MLSVMLHQVILSFGRQSIGHEGRNLIFVLVYKIISLQSSEFYLVFFCVFTLSVGIVL